MTSVPESRPPQILADLAPAQWIVPLLQGPRAVAGDLVPAGYECYVRIMHPFDRPYTPAFTEAGELAGAGTGNGAEDVSWQQVAAWSGRTLHPLAQYPQIANPAPGHGAGPKPWDGSEPNCGAMSDAQLRALFPLLAAATATADQCWFCLWEGFGYLHPAYGSSRQSIAVFTSSGDPPPPLPPPPVPVPGLDVTGFPRVELPARSYYLFSGPLRSAALIGTGLGPDPISERLDGPNLWWPDDWAWFIGTDIDLDSTFVACSRQLAEAILAEPRLEAFLVQPGDSFYEDPVNPAVPMRGARRPPGSVARLLDEILCRTHLTDAAGWLNASMPGVRGRVPHRLLAARARRQAGRSLQDAYEEQERRAGRDPYPGAQAGHR